MEETEEPEMFDMEVVCDTPQEQSLDYGFSDKVIASRFPDIRQGNVKKIIYIEEDSSDSSLDSDCEVNVYPRQKHTTQKITIENVAEKKQVFFKRKLDLSPGQPNRTKTIKYSSVSGDGILNLPQLDKLLTSVTCVQTHQDVPSKSSEQNVTYSTVTASNSIIPPVQKTASICTSTSLTPTLLGLVQSSSKTVLSVNETSVSLPNTNLPVNSVSCPPSSHFEAPSLQSDKNYSAKIEQNWRHSYSDYGPSSYYPSAFKLGLIEFSGTRSLKEAATLFRIPKEVIEDWTVLQTEIREQFQKDFFTDWEKDVFLDIINLFSKKELVFLKDVIEKRKNRQRSTQTSDGSSMLKWAVDWCKQFRFQLENSQAISEMTVLKLPGRMKNTVEKDTSSSDWRLRTFSPQYKLRVLQYADRHSVRDSAQRFHLKSATIRRWFCERSIIEKQTAKRKSQKHALVKMRHKKLEDELSEWYKSMIVKGKVVRHSLVISKARSLARKLNWEDFEPTLHWYNSWFKSHLKSNKDYTQKVGEHSAKPDTSLPLKDEWNKLLQEVHTTSCAHLENVSQGSECKPDLTDHNASPDSNLEKHLLDCGQEVSGFLPSDRDGGIPVNSGSYNLLPLSGEDKANSKEDLSTNEHVKTVHPSDSAWSFTKGLLPSDIPLPDSFPVKTPVPSEHNSECNNIYSAQTNSSEGSKSTANTVNVERSDCGSIDNMNVQVVLEKLSDENSIGFINSDIDLVKNSEATISTQPRPSEPVVQIEQFVKDHSRNCDNDLQTFQIVTNENLGAHPSVKVVGVSAVIEENEDSFGSSHNPSLGDSSLESSVYSSYDSSNSSAATHNNIHRDSLTGSFQQIFLKFAQDGKQHINDQSALNHTSGSQSKHSNSGSEDEGNRVVQSSYVLRNKTSKTAAPENNNVKKPSCVKPSRPTDIKHIPPEMYSKTSTTISRRLGYSSAAGALKRHMHLSDGHPTKKQGKNRKRTRKQSTKKTKVLGSEPTRSIAVENVTSNNDFEQMELEEFEAPSYPACFQTRVIENAEIKGLEVTSAEFGLNYALVNDWIHSKNSIKMLSKVENYKEWELDLYVLVHKLNVKGQKLSLLDLISKGSEVLSALNLADCYTFQEESALDWCERFGVGLSDGLPEPNNQPSKHEESLTHPQHEESHTHSHQKQPIEFMIENQPSNHEESFTHHRQKHPIEFMIEVCNYTMKNSSIKAHKKYGVPLSTIRTWIVKDILSRRKSKDGNATDQSALLSKEKSELKVQVLDSRHSTSVASLSQGGTFPVKRTARKSFGGSVRNAKLQDGSSAKARIVKAVQDPDTLNSGSTLKLKSRKDNLRLAITHKNHNKALLRLRKKYISVNRGYTDEFRQQVLSYVKQNGVQAASAKFRLNTSVIYHWGGGRSSGQSKFSPEVKAKAMEYADRYSLSKASEKFSVSTSLLSSWRIQRKIEIKGEMTAKRQVGRPVKKKKLPGENRVSLHVDKNKQNTPVASKQVIKVHRGLRVKTLDNLEADLANTKSKKDLEIRRSKPTLSPSVSQKIPPEVMKTWAKYYRLHYPDYTSEFILKAVTYANEYGLKAASKEHNVEYKLIHSWLLRYENAYKSGRLTGSVAPHSKEYIEKVVAYAKERSCKSASEHFKLPKSSIYCWMRTKKTANQKEESSKDKEQSDLEKVEKELLTWCQVMQFSTISIRASKIISKAKSIAHQCNIDESLLSQDWYKTWVSNYKDVLLPNPVQDLDLPTKMEVDDEYQRTESSSTKTYEEETTPAAERNSGSVHGDLKTEDTGTENTMSSDVNFKGHSHYTRKVNRKFCRFCDHHEGHGNPDIAHKHDHRDTDSEVSDHAKANVSDCDSKSDIVTAQEQSISANTEISAVDLMDSSIDKGNVPPGSRDSCARSCKSSFRTVSRLSNDADEDVASVATSTDEKLPGGTTVWVISDPGWVFCNWIKEVNDSRQYLSPLEVTEKLEYIVQSTNEDHFDNWLFRLYHECVRNVSHPLVDTKTISSVLGLDGYVSAEVKLQILEYMERRGIEETSSCFQFSQEKLRDWLESKRIFHLILRVQKYFVTYTKNVHIDLDIYEWYLKTSSKQNDVTEAQIRSQAEEVYIQHNGKSLKRYYKWFLERFQRITALDYVDKAILKRILENSDCNISMYPEELISLYEDNQKSQELKSLFPTSQIWFEQFQERYSDVLSQAPGILHVLPAELERESQKFKREVLDWQQDLGLCCIGSMDEIPIWFSSKPKNSVDPTPNLLENGFRDADGVVLFSCLANGTVLSPFLTFKNTCKKNVRQTPENIVTDPVLSQWLQKVWLVEVKETKSIVILDSFQPHTSAKFRHTAEQANVHLALVPPGCNSSANPVVSLVRSRFQVLLGELRNQMFGDAVLERNEVVSLVNDAYCKIFQEHEFVKRSFQVTGVVSSL